MTARLRIEIDDDQGPLGFREVKASGYPREMGTTSIPIKYPTCVGSITLPRQMTAAEWDLVMDVVALVRRATEIEVTP